MFADSTRLPALFKCRPSDPNRCLRSQKTQKIVYKTNVMFAASSHEPGVQAEQSAKTAKASAAGGGGARNKNTDGTVKVD